MKRKLTQFEKDVLTATLDIPLGEVRTYQWIAEKIGRPKAVRAVGQALRHNPYPVMIPCHRVIKSDGSLGAYAGKYDQKKEKLLKKEQEIIKDLETREGFPP